MQGRSSCPGFMRKVCRTFPKAAADCTSLVLIESLMVWRLLVLCHWYNTEVTLLWLNDSSSILYCAILLTPFTIICIFYFSFWTLCRSRTYILECQYYHTQAILSEWCHQEMCITYTKHFCSRKTLCCWVTRPEVCSAVLPSTRAAELTAATQKRCTACSFLLPAPLLACGFQLNNSFLPSNCHENCGGLISCQLLPCLLNVAVLW